MLLGVFLVGEIIPVFVSCSEMGAAWQEEQTGAWEGTDSFSFSQISAPQERLYSTWIGYVPHNDTSCCGMRAGEAQSGTHAVVPSGAVCWEGFII